MTAAAFPSHGDIALFQQQGFLIVRQLAKPETIQALQNAAKRNIENPVQPWELESSTGYPGAPNSVEAPGGDTIRRLLNAVCRDKAWADWATSAEITNCLARLFKAETLFLNTSHHNCLMTKAPAYSSDTGWHQDIRYWHFNQPNLISVWTALGEENQNNGSLSVIPGSHAMKLTPTQFDEAQFFDPTLEDNQSILAKEVSVSLAPGDVLFFHCKLLHRASRNKTDQVKLSLVFTYHDDQCQPLPNTRSSRDPEIQLAPASCAL